ncbi:hypothetical protein [Photorhabdus namnaonensis]|uniref:hypothetical protein n=1 Tax=Photorhabdus namnaonensis TaxID=1851568 RepID=UPI0008083CF9
MIEPSVADVKPHHGHHYARFLGLLTVQIPCLLAVIVRNTKKIALWVATFCGFYLWMWEVIRCNRDTISLPIDFLHLGFNIS